MRTAQSLACVSPWFLPVGCVMTLGVTLVRLTFYPGNLGALAMPLVILLALMIDQLGYRWIQVEKRCAAKKLQGFLQVFFFVISIVWSVSILAMMWADQNGWPDEVTTAIRRSFGIMFAIWMMAFGNYLPKLASPWRYGEEPFNWQGVHQFAGVAMFCCGLLVLFGWCLLPLDQAKPLAIASVAITSLTVVARKWFSLATWRHKNVLR